MISSLSVDLNIIKWSAISHVNDGFVPFQVKVRYSCTTFLLKLKRRSTISLIDCREIHHFWIFVGSVGFNCSREVSISVKHIGIGNGTVPTFSPVDGVVLQILYIKVGCRNSSTKEFDPVICTIVHSDVLYYSS